VGGGIQEGIVFEETGVSSGGRDGSMDVKGPADAARVIFEASSPICTAGCCLVQLNMPSKQGLSSNTLKVSLSF